MYLAPPAKEENCFKQYVYAAESCSAAHYGPVLGGYFGMVRSARLAVCPSVEFSPFCLSHGAAA